MAHNNTNRPTPLWVQGLVTGLTIALLIVTVALFCVDYQDRSLMSLTEVLMALCPFAVGALAWAYLPVPAEPAPSRVR